MQTADNHPDSTKRADEFKEPNEPEGGDGEDDTEQKKYAGGPKVISSFLLLVVWPGATSSFLLLVAMPGTPSSFLILF